MGDEAGEGADALAEDALHEPAAGQGIGLLRLA